MAKYPLLASALLVLLLLVLVCSIAIPVWSTNDDAGMAMIAHGYGNMERGAPTLIFSNILWGYIVRAIPSIMGVTGYAIATMASLWAAGSVMGWSLLRLGVSRAAAALAMVSILVSPMVFPQFTLVSAFYCMAAVLLLQVYAHTPQHRLLVLACLLAFLSCLVRDQMFLLLAAISVPFLPWRLLRRDRAVQIALLLFILAIGVAWCINFQAYQGPEWKIYRTFNAARLPFTDFHAARYAVQNMDMLTRHGFTGNDMVLVSNWFFLDPYLNDPARLNGLLNDIGPIARQNGSAALSAQGLALFFGAMLLPQLIPAGLLYFSGRDRRVLASFSLIIAAIFVIGLFGRPGVMHVYQGLAYFLLAMAVLKSKPGNRWLLLALGIGLAITVAHLSITQRTAFLQVNELRQEVTQLPDEPLIAWGAAFPYEYMYPVLGRDGPARKLDIYALGASMYAPFSKASAMEKAGFHPWERLRSPEGILMVTNRPQLGALAPYCAEHFGLYMKADPAFVSDAISVYRVRCVE